MLETEFEILENAKTAVVSLIWVLFEHLGDDTAEKVGHIGSDGADGRNGLGKMKVRDIDDIFLEGGTQLREWERFCGEKMVVEGDTSNKKLEECRSQTVQV